MFSEGLVVKVFRLNWLVGVFQLVFVIAVLALAFMIVGALGKIQDRRAPLQAEIADHEALAVSVQQPHQNSYVPVLDLNGVVAAQSQVSIAGQVGGRVVMVSEKFKAGGEIARGELIFRIDPADYKLAVESAEAEIAAARSSLAQIEAEATLAVEEWEALYPGQPISELAARKPQIAAAKAALQAAEAARKKAELALSRTNIYASEDIRILSSQLTIGQIVAANQSVGTAFPVSAIEITAPLSLEDAAIISPAIGRTVTIIQSTGPAWQVSGEVVRQDAALDGKTRLSTLFIKPDFEHDLSVGTFVKVRVEGSPVEDAMFIPKSAFSERDQVWVVSNDRLSPRIVNVLGEEDAYSVVRRFHAADGVVTIPPGNVFEGMEVSIRSEGK